MKLKHCRKEHRRSGFTLIELLVVVAIISIIAAILFPVFARARENARRTSCQSNLKQYGLAVQMYSQDFDERLVPLHLYYGTTEGYHTWVEFLQPYTKSDQLPRCPSVSLPAAYSTHTQRFTYGMNGNLYILTPQMPPGYSTPTSFADAVPLPRITRPAETVLLSDNALNIVSGTSVVCGYYRTWPPSFWATAGLDNWWELKPRSGQAAITQRHFDGANVLWVDGHVKFAKLPGPITAGDTLWDMD